MYKDDIPYCTYHNRVLKHLKSKCLNSRNNKPNPACKYLVWLDKDTFKNRGDNNGSTNHSNISNDERINRCNSNE